MIVATSKRTKLSKLQESVYLYIRRYYRLQREGPCFDEINKVFGSHEPRHLTAQLMTLEKSGFIQQDRFTERFRPLMLFMEDQMIDLPLAETEVLSAMSEICLTEAEMPTREELAERLGLPVSELIELMRKLELRGLVRQDPSIPRSFKINTDLAFGSD